MRMISFAFPLIFNDLQPFNRSKTLRFNDLPGLPDEPSRNHDEQLTYDNPPTSKNSDGFSL